LDFGYCGFGFFGFGYVYFGFGVRALGFVPRLTWSNTQQHLCALSFVVLFASLSFRLQASAFSSGTVFLKVSKKKVLERRQTALHHHSSAKPEPICNIPA
jgi:hypothetical protein